MKIQELGVAGTMESGDIMVTIEESGDQGINVDLDSSVEKQFGDKICKVIICTLKDLGIGDASVKAVDKGALDCTICARVKAAAFRACKEESYSWKGTK